MHGVELSVIEGALDDMKTLSGAAEFRQWLHVKKTRYKLFRENGVSAAMTFARPPLSAMQN